MPRCPGGTTSDPWAAQMALQPVDYKAIFRGERESAVFYPQFLCYLPDYALRISFQFTFPHYQNCPASCLKLSSVACIPVYVFVELLLPKILASRRHRRISAASMTMPEAAMDEDYSAMFRENNIWSAWQLFRVHAKSEADAMQHGSQSQFRLSIAPPDARHVPAPSFTGQCIGHYCPPWGELSYFGEQVATKCVSAISGSRRLPEELGNDFT